MFPLLSASTKSNKILHSSSPRPEFSPPKYHWNSSLESDPSSVLSLPKTLEKPYHFCQLVERDPRRKSLHWLVLYPFGETWCRYRVQPRGTKMLLNLAAWGPQSSRPLLRHFATRPTSSRLAPPKKRISTSKNTLGAGVIKKKKSSTSEDSSPLKKKPKRDYSGKRGEEPYVAPELVDAATQERRRHAAQRQGIFPLNPSNYVETVNLRKELTKALQRGDPDTVWELRSKIKGLQRYILISLLLLTVLSVDYERMINCMAEHGRVDKAFKMYNFLKKAQLKPRPCTFFQLFNVCFEHFGWILTNSFQACKNAVGEGHYVERCFYILDQMNKYQVPISLHCYNVILQVCANQGDQQSAKMIYASMSSFFGFSY